MGSRVKKNFIYNIAYQILVLILPLVTAPYLSRVIGGDGIGIYSYTHAFANYFVLLSLLGVDNYGNREIARVRDDGSLKNKTFWEIYVIQLSLTIILCIGYSLYVIVSSPKYALIYMLQLFYVVSSAFNINWYFWGVEKFKLTVIRNTAIKVLTTVCIFVFVKGSADLWLYTLILSLGTLLSNAVVWPFLLKEVRPVRITWDGIKQHIKPDLVLFIPVVAVSLYNVMDKLMLGTLSSYAEVGYYTYAEKIVQVPVTIIIALGTVMMPHVTNLLAKGEDEECKTLFDKAMLFVLFMSFAFSFGMANLAPVFSDWYYGTAFARCGQFMILLTPVIVFKSWANLVRTQFIIPRGFDKIYILSVSMGALVNLLLNAILIPRYEGIGAIIGTVAAEFVVCFIQTWKTKESVTYMPHLKDGVAFSIIGLLMYYAMMTIQEVVSIQSKFVLLLLCFVIGAIVYCMLSYVFLTKIKKDRLVIPVLKRKLRKYIKRIHK